MGSFLATVLGAGFALFGVVPAWRSWRRDRRTSGWTHVEGRIVDACVRRRTHDGDDVYAAQVSYRIADGRYLTAWAPDGFLPDVRHHVGGPIHVWYAPSDPDTFRAARTPDPRTSPWLYAFHGGFAFAGLVVLLVTYLA